MRASARARSRRDEETLDVVPERNSTRVATTRTTSGSSGNARTPSATQRDEADEADEAERASKPLGWLFRSSSDVMAVSGDDATTTLAAKFPEPPWSRRRVLAGGSRSCCR